MLHDQRSNRDCLDVYRGGQKPGFRSGLGYPYGRSDVRRLGGSSDQRVRRGVRQGELSKVVLAPWGDSPIVGDCLPVRWTMLGFNEPEPFQLGGGILGGGRLGENWRNIGSGRSREPLLF